MPSLRIKSCCSLILSIVIMLSIALTPAMAYGSNDLNITKGSSLSENRLPITLPIDAPRMLQGKLSEQINTDSDVINYFSSNRQTFGLTQSLSSIKFVEKTQDIQGKQHYRLQQHYMGIPIYGNYITAHVDTNKQLYAVTNDSSSELDSISLNIQPKVSSTEAVNLLQAEVESEVGYSITLGGQYLSRELGQPKAELIIYPFNGTFHLAYRLDMEYKQPQLSRWVGFVDAHTGVVLKKFSRLEQVAPADSRTGNGQGYYGNPRVINITEESVNEFYLTDKTKPMYRIENGREAGVIETYDTENPFFPVSSSSTNFADPEAVEAHYFAGQVYDFYADKYNRNSLDGNGMSIISVVNAGAIDNAFWNGYEVVYGDGSQQFGCLTCANDVIAHELTHAVTEHSANLEYIGQSGALNESISDIMAAVFDAQDWAIGEDLGVAGGHGVLRDLERPERGLEPQPFNMAGYVYLPEDAANDNGGIHTNSGIPNHAAYLIATGIDELPGLQGQGRILLGEITYGALTSYLTPTSRFLEARDSFVLAAGDLLLPDDQKNAVIAVVKDSWATVGLPYTNNENDIVSLSVMGMEGKSEVNSLAHTVTFKVKYGTNLNGIIPQIGISPGATISPSPSEPQNFTSPVSYTITSKSGQTQTWMVQGSISDPQTLNEIVEFNADFLAGPAIIDPIQHKVTLYAEDNDYVTVVQPSIVLSEGASISPASGSSVNLDQPVTYLVTSENGTTQQWTVTVIKDSTSPKVLGAVSLRSTIVAVVFDKEMNFSTLGNVANYKLESLISSYSNPQITKVEVDCADPSVVYLTTSALVSQNGYKVSVSNLQGANGYSVRPDSTTGYFLTEDNMQPVLSTARIEGKQLALTFNEYVQGTYYAQSAFQVNVNNAAVMVDSITSVGRRVILTLSSEVSSADSIKVTYAPTSSFGRLTDLSGNIVPAFDRVDVINRTNVTLTAAGQDWVRFYGDIKQVVKHPTEPVIYTIFDDSFNVVSANMETGNTITTTLDRQPERLYLSGGKLYVALVDQPHSSYWWEEDQTGSIAILNETTLHSIQQFNVPTDPFDMVVSENGMIYVSSGSGQWTDFSSISSVTEAVYDKGFIRQGSYLQKSGSNRIYSIDTDSSPRDIRLYNVTAEGQFMDNDYDSPYHGDYPLSTLLRISPDYNYLFNGAGKIFTSSSIKEDDMRFVSSIDPFSSIVFSEDLQKFYTLNGQTLRTYNYASLTLEKQVALPATAFEILPGNTANELLVAYSEYGGTTLLPYSLLQNQQAALGVQSLAGQSATSSAYSEINACTIPVSGGGPVGGGPVGGGPVGGGPVGGGPIGGGPVGSVPPVAVTAKTTVNMNPDDLMMSNGADSQGNLEAYFKPDPAKTKQALLDAQAGVDQVRDESGKTVIPKVVIPVGELGSSLTVELPASTFVEANKTSSKAVIIVQSKDVTYELPVQALNVANLKKAWGSEVDLNSVRIKVVMEKTESTLSNQIRGQLKTEGYIPLTDSIKFTVGMEQQGIFKEVVDFNGTYVTRSFTLNGTEDTNYITALIYDSELKTFNFVPAFVRKEGEKTLLDIKAPHNSIYLAARSFKTFKDISGHWAKNDIEIMASKRIVYGINDTEFNPDQQVTRAEFAALLVRSLGQATPQTSSLRFVDVDQKAWYAATVSVAAQTGLIAGDTTGRFTPNGIITRQEMAAMINRAIKYTGDTGYLPDPDKKTISTDAILDVASFAKWASKDINSMLERGIMDVGLNGKFEPALPVTRANAAVALKRMLQSVKFINE